MSREQIIQDIAYAIWEAEGRPEGRAVEHWRLAEAQLTESAAAPPAGKAGKTGAATPKAGVAKAAAVAPRKPAAPRKKA